MQNFRHSNEAVELHQFLLPIIDQLACGLKLFTHSYRDTPRIDTTVIDSSGQELILPDGSRQNLSVDRLWIEWKIKFHRFFRIYERLLKIWINGEDKAIVKLQQRGYPPFDLVDKVLRKIGLTNIGSNRKYTFCYSDFFFYVCQSITDTTYI